MRNVKQFFRPTEKQSLFLNPDVQVGDSNNLPLNVSRRSLIKYYSINYFLHKNYYNFLMQKKKFMILFFLLKKNRFLLVRVKFNVQLNSSIIFNDQVKKKIRGSFVKRVMVNGMTGSSWIFKRFEHLSLISTETKKFFSKIKKWNT